MFSKGTRSFIAKIGRAAAALPAKARCFIACREQEFSPHASPAHGGTPEPLDQAVSVKHDVKALHVHRQRLASAARGVVWAAHMSHTAVAHQMTLHWLPVAAVLSSAAPSAPTHLGRRVRIGHLFGVVARNHPERRGLLQGELQGGRRGQYQSNTSIQCCRVKKV